VLHKRTFILSIVFSLFTSYLLAEPKIVKLDELDGNWHLRIIDGMEARIARAILEFNSQNMTISGFDGCNKISGTLTLVSDNNMTSKLISTKMACREPIHAYASKKLHETLVEGFSIAHTQTNGIDGITIKSQNHELFFKKMGKETTSSWMPFNFDFDSDKTK